MTSKFAAVALQLCSLALAADNDGKTTAERFAINSYMFNQDCIGMLPKVFGDPNPAFITSDIQFAQNVQDDFRMFVYPDREEPDDEGRIPP